MYSVELYRRLGGGVDPGWHECGGIRLACDARAHAGAPPPGGLGAHVRAAARADLRRRGAGAVPADGHRQACRARRSCRPTATSIRAADLALAEGARRGGGADLHQYAGDRDRGGRRARRGACRPSAARSSPRSSSTPAGCTRPRSAGWPACGSRSCRSRTSTWSRSRSGNATGEHLPTMRDPDRLIYFREEGGGLVMGGYERAARRGPGDEGAARRDPADFNGRLLEEDWERFEEIAANAPGACRRSRGRSHADQRPGGVHARRRVHPGRDRGPRVLRRRRLLRARARRRRAGSAR